MIHIYVNGKYNARSETRCYYQHNKEHRTRNTQQQEGAHEGSEGSRGWGAGEGIVEMRGGQVHVYLCINFLSGIV